MNPEQQARWKQKLLQVIFSALAESPALNKALVFKGAMVLTLRLEGMPRLSLDLDAGLTAASAKLDGDLEHRHDQLAEEIRLAVKAAFERDIPQVYVLDKVSVEYKPRRNRTLAWDGVRVKLTIRDERLSLVRGIPPVTMDIAAPEDLTEHSTAPLRVGGTQVVAYTLERIAAEKLRGLLQSLPEWREKVGGDRREPRVKDLQDLARIEARHPIRDDGFWNIVESEFKVACASRFVDCEGIETYTAQRDELRAVFNADATLPADISFDTAWGALERVMKRMRERGVLPLRHPLPPGA